MCHHLPSKCHFLTQEESRGGGKERDPVTLFYRNAQCLNPVPRLLWWELLPTEPSFQPLSISLKKGLFIYFDVCVPCMNLCAPWTGRYTWRPHPLELGFTDSVRCLMWTLGTELKVLDLVASTFPFWAISLALYIKCWLENKTMAREMAEQLRH